MISDRLLCLLVLIIANVSYFFDWQIATHQLKIRKKDFCLNKLCQEYKHGKNASGSPVRLLLQINGYAGRFDPHVRFSAHRYGLCIDYLH